MYREKLITLADNSCKIFSQRLTPGDSKILGVRVPKIRALAKEIIKSDYKTYLETARLDYLEEKQLYGLVIGLMKEDTRTTLFYLDKWLPCVDSWAACDIGMMRFNRFVGEEREQVFDFLREKLISPMPYIKRAAIVGMFDYINDRASCVAKLYQSVTDEHYYVKMALAWGMCEIAIKSYDVACDVFKNGSLTVWVQNKSIQKSCESYRLTNEQKLQLKTFKKLI